MEEKHIRLALHPSINEELIDKAAWDLNWNISTYGEPEEGYREDVYFTLHGQSHVRVMYDDVVHLRYLTVTGAFIDYVVKDIRIHLIVVEPETAIKGFYESQNNDEKAAYIQMMGIGATSANKEDVLKVLDLAAADADPKIRLAMIHAIDFIGWEELKPKLEALKSDPDPEAAKLAAAMAEAFDLPVEAWERNP